MWPGQDHFWMHKFLFLFSHENQQLTSLQKICKTTHVYSGTNLLTKMKSEDNVNIFACINILNIN